MDLFMLEHDESAFRADVALYAVSAVALTSYLILRAQPDQVAATGTLVLLGVVGWTLVEYLMHRLVFHGVDPIRRWHAEHHRRPTALIFTPTIVSVTLIGVLVFLPALVEWNLLRASALTLGVVAGYLIYTLTHHATHNWHADNAWLRRRKRWHALHHHQIDVSTCYGVTTSFWDHVFGTTHRVQ
jgi:sterol desaturase/sphingolipid hydroxylase (fatty acid hydroxylase superfamily)